MGEWDFGFEKEKIEFFVSNFLKDNSNSRMNYRLSIKNILFFFTIAIVIGIIVYVFSDHRSNQEIFKNAENLIKKQQYEKAIEELEIIQEKYIPAKALLGNLLSLNDSVNKDIKRGEKLLLEAAEANDSNAFKSLTDLYVGNKSWDETYKFFKKFADKGMKKAYRGLVWLYFTDEYNGKENDNKNLKKAEYYALKLADNDAWCCGVLGDIYSESGDGIEQDYSKAYYWWNKGGKMNQYHSCHCYSNLGWLYQNGYGVRQNYKKAYESYIKAINMQTEESFPYYQLSVLFRNGLYVKPNKDSVKYYLNKASEYGDEDAAVELEDDFN